MPRVNNEYSCKCSGIWRTVKKQLWKTNSYRFFFLNVSYVMHIRTNAVRKTRVLISTLSELVQMHTYCPKNNIPGASANFLLNSCVKIWNCQPEVHSPSVLSERTYSFVRETAKKELQRDGKETAKRLWRDCGESQQRDGKEKLKARNLQSVLSTATSSKDMIFARYRTHRESFIPSTIDAVWFRLPNEIIGPKVSNGVLNINLAYKSGQ
jgi:hypothetical protein